MKVTAVELMKWYGVDRRTVTNWLNSTPPCPSQLRGRIRQFDTVDVARWKDSIAGDRAVAKREKECQPSVNLDAARQRKVEAEAQLAELELAERRGEIIPLSVYEERITRLCEQLAARCKTLGRYMGDVQRALTDIDAAELLERIQDDLLRALMATDDLDDEEREEGGCAKQPIATT
jgi:phage terminase Nu1 subunit (DNA packaging protein)